jgi:hypothetical protein
VYVPHFTAPLLQWVLVVHILCLLLATHNVAARPSTIASARPNPAPAFRTPPHPAHRPPPAPPSITAAVGEAAAAAAAAFPNSATVQECPPANAPPLTSASAPAGNLPPQSVPRNSTSSSF